MRYRKQTPDGDYSFGSSQLDFYHDLPDAVAQAVKTRLLLWLGEWFLDIEDGTPYMTGILGKHTQTEADTTIQARVSATQGFVNFSAYSSDLDPDSRKLSVAMTVNTIYGPTDLQVANYVNY